MTLLTGIIGSSGGSGTPPSYTGPGDVVSGALQWYGLRAYTSASIGGNCCDIIRASDSSSQTFTTVSGGGVDAAGIATFLTATTGKITKLYDQTGNGFDVVQATDGNRPAIALNALGSFPAARFLGSSGTKLESAGNAVLTAQPFTFSWVAVRTGANTSFGSVLGSGPQALSGFNNATNQVYLYAGGADSASATDNSTHAVQAVFNGSSSVLYVDGSSTTTNPGVGSIAVAHVFFGSDIFANDCTGDIFEGGIWGSGFNGTQQSNMNSNQHSYWGF